MSVNANWHGSVLSKHIFLINNNKNLLEKKQQFIIIYNHAQSYRNVTVQAHQCRDTKNDAVESVK